MANYYETMVSNDFKTKNNEEVSRVLRNTYGVEEVWVNNNGTMGFGNYGEDSCLMLDTSYVLFKKDTHDFMGVYDEEVDEVENIIPSDDIDLFEGLSYEEIQEKIHQEYEVINLVEYLQHMLLEDEYILINTIGNEKLRYVGGSVTLISKLRYDFKDLRHVAEELVANAGLDVEKV